MRVVLENEEFDQAIRTRFRPGEITGRRHWARRKVSATKRREKTLCV